MEQEAIRQRLQAATQQRGRITFIAREVEMDPRTLRSIASESHPASADTIDKLARYFKKVDRRKA